MLRALLLSLLLPLVETPLHAQHGWGDVPGPVGIPSPSVAGDYNGDGRAETVRLEPAMLNEGEDGCLDSLCRGYLRFSDPRIPPIEIPSCIGGAPENLGDLDGDGAAEIGLLPDWFTSCWRSYYVYSFNKRSGQWALAVQLSTHCIQWESEPMPWVRRDPKKKGYVLTRYSKHLGDSIAVRSASVRFKK